MRCVIISGSPETNPNFLKQAVKPDDYVICADRGYEFAKLAGIEPDLIVGDFDSYKEKISENCEIVKLNPHKDDTDTIHAIDLAFKQGFTEFLLLGALGGRIDHTFANISALYYIADRGGKGILLSENERVEFLERGEYCFDGYCGKTFSLFPFGCESVCVSYQGAEYPLDRYRIKSSVPLGISNVFISEKSEIKIYDGNAILIINLKEEYI
ncbi:thiamine diphosphokinase [Ruminococcus sp.]|uniref:thiamine diphosphokinase n=1 Tax=Ruminococcus sp. TaxID=41978 RepID=UPI003F0C70E1